MFSIFTKGVELGSDEFARQVYGGFGINSAKELVRRIAEYDNVSILLGFNSFFPEIQDSMVGSLNAGFNYRIIDGVFDRRGVMHYTEIRNRALVNLVEAGFNLPESRQRLTRNSGTEFTWDEAAEAASMYKWAALRNMPIIITPTMESGPMAIGLSRFNIKLRSGSREADRNDRSDLLPH